MILAKVKERVVSTARLQNLPARQLLTVEPLPGFGSRQQPFIAIDTVEAGPGDTVLVMAEGTGARQVLDYLDNEPLAAQMVIVGVVDQIQGVETIGNA